MVLGPGPRGLACVVAAMAAGAEWVGVSGLDVDNDRLAIAHKLGANLTVNASTEDVAASVADHLGTRPDVVIDVTSDDPEAMFTALDLVRSGGRVILASTKGNRPVQFFSDLIVTKQLTLRGALGASSNAYDWACDQVAADPRIDDLVSHQFPLTEASPRPAGRGRHARPRRIDLGGRHLLIGPAISARPHGQSRRRRHLGLDRLRPGQHHLRPGGGRPLYPLLAA